MAKLQVLSKGKYLDPQPNQPVTLSQYIFALQDKTKYLLLRFKNERAELLTDLKFAVKQLNAKGNEIDTSIVECNNLKGAPSGMVTLNRQIEVKRDCADFKVYLISASYGKYIYSVKNHATYLTYDDAVTVPRLKNEDIFARIGSSDRIVTVRKLRRPVFSVFMAILAIAMVIATAVIQTIDYSSTAKNFTLHNITYKIVGSNQIYVTGYRGEAINVTIPETIEGYKVVGMTENAFANNSKLKKLVVNSPIEIPAGAFSNCGSLVSVELKKVTGIGEEAFYNCTALKTFSADSLELIGQDAFNGCSSLQSVIIEHKSKTLRIGKSAFAYCPSLQTVKINQNVNWLYHVDIFNGSAIAELYLKNIANCPLKDYFVYSNADITKLTVGHMDNIPRNFLYESEVKSLTVESLGVTSIYDSAFEGNSKLEEIVFKTPILEVGSRAFADSGIKAFSFKGVAVIGGRAFEGCENLESVDLSQSNVTYLPQLVFGGCKDLKAVKLSAKILSIDQFAFKDCSSLKEIVIPQNVETVGMGAFFGCSDLEKMTVFYIGGSLTENTSMTYLFLDEDGTTMFTPLSLKQISVTCPDITEVPQGAFYGFSGLEKVAFASPVTSVGYRAFYGCGDLANFPFSESLITIEEEAFYDTGFTEITIPASVTDVGVRAFASSEDLKVVRVPTTVQSLGHHFIGDCEGLEELLLPYIGNTVSDSAPLSEFTADSSLGNLKKVAVTSESYDTVADNTFCNAHALTDVSLPSSIVSIGDYAFSGCTSLEAINLPNTVTEIGRGAFSNTKFTRFAFPSLVTRIEGETFKDCEYLREITIPRDVTAIGEDAFYGCLYLHEIYNYSDLSLSLGSIYDGGVATNALVIYQQGDAAVPKVVNGPYEFLQVDGDWILAYCHDADLAEIKLPSQIEYQGVTSYRYSILRYTFTDMDGIQSVEIPSAVTEIGDLAFYSCESLTSVSVQDGNLSSIGEKAFYNCYSLEDFDFVSSLSYIGKQAFYDCRSLNSISISGRISAIEEETFYNCTSVQSIVLPSTLQTIGERAFYGCHYVLNIVLPSGLSSIGDGAFGGCDSIMSVWNKSHYLTVTAGSTSNGGVALYAKTVRTAGQTYAFEVFTDGDYRVIHDNGTYWIYKYTGSLDSGSVLKLPEQLTHNGSTVYRYGLSKDTFVEIDSHYSLYVPTSVQMLDRRVFSYNNPQTVYYASNRSSWDYLTQGVDTFFSVIYYSPCIHESGYWKYDENGNITTSIDQPVYTTVVPATCTQNGYSQWDCPYCSHYETRTDYALGHNFGANGQCSRCTAMRVKITSQNINTYSQYISFVLDENFTIDETGEIRSQNVTAGTTASMSIILRVSGISLEFDYGAVSGSSSNNATFTDFECGTVANIRNNRWHSHEYDGTGTVRFSYYCGHTNSNNYGYVRYIYVIIP
ncbi:MAG: leucine-rich repeat domain-containing protein [Clostridia bacterium]|nr:leucine-rich repeat domain-containing protein [Clostridia bacterium]